MFNSLDVSIGYPTVLTGRRIVHFLYSHLRLYDITPEQWTILRYLGGQDGITQKELSQKSGKDQATVTRILDILDRKELIVRQSNASDRRSFLVYLTEEGKALRDTIEPIMQEIYEKVFNGIPEEKLEIFLEVLNQVNENLEYELEKQTVR
ncbi:DNA-binding MarR family transcriptional regulator [Scopulibacillus daqui]|uniref:DNA-binding MarR family transcriptional regulator n=1 Tax=Scopulibacillus daqui TaxID=1469162 RepID=A0ABS2Q2V7_9BACL|nr:MarR family transcriptional regulator [Scopulibacillus daqui]MBM7646553.1 DNA-binding MarR family transcriptional regulator [Scopulibacillus daqui]